MRKYLLGTGLIYRIVEADGQTYTSYDQDSLSRDDFRGEFAGEDYDYSDDDDTSDEDDEFGDDDFGEDDFGEDDDDFGEDDEFGASRGRQRRQARRGRRRSRRKGRRESRRSRRKGGGEKKMEWIKTVVGESEEIDSTGPAALKLQLQHHLKAEDIVFNGSATDAKVTSIIFGDKLIWNNAKGLDVSIFSSSSFIRGLVKGAKLRAGQIISINGSVANDGDTFAAAIIGLKPASTC